MSQLYNYLSQHINQTTQRIVFSKTKSPTTKIIVRQYLAKDNTKYQIERHVNNQVFHTNVEITALLDNLAPDVDNYGQVNITNSDLDIQLLINKKGQLHTTTKPTNNTIVTQSHNKAKQYILSEGSDIPALRDLGIFDSNNHLIKSKTDKYRQINRFIEIIDQQMKNFDKSSITILDYGCGKSYLTFLVYHYFAVLKNIDITVFGYDLKEDVVTHCNNIAQQYNYASLHFVVADVTKDTINAQVDMIMTLHACDTATDYALHHAIVNNVPYIFSVPCCQHEINSTIKCHDNTNILLADGLIKERFSALLTDSIRVEILRQCGYEVDVIEFVDMSHTPKNLLIRAKKHKTVPIPNLVKVQQLLSQYNTTQQLYALLNN